MILHGQQKTDSNRFGFQMDTGQKDQLHVGEARRAMVQVRRVQQARFSDGHRGQLHTQHHLMNMSSETSPQRRFNKPLPWAFRNSACLRQTLDRSALLGLFHGAHGSPRLPRYRRYSALLSSR